MAGSALPDAEYLRQSFDYFPLTGDLFWRPKPRAEFTLDRIWRMWCTKNLGHRAGYQVTINGISYWKVSADRREFFQHRLIWKLVTGDDPPMVDHVDGNGLNNRWRNLRLATKPENARNSVRHRDRTSALPKGVYRHRSRFVASIMVDRVNHRLGSFSTVEEAAAAYAEAANRLHGEFARLT